ncbi:MAG: ATP-binding protein [Bacteroidales bacterium]|nr:ATP-binding protein [Bacteroidales bacterium]MBN2698494.1 ATP-binding protein [Bacteroidales bacterium]
MIERKLTDRFFSYLKHFPVVGIVGPRQVGKTTFIKLNMERFPRPAVYLDLESPEDYNKLQDPELYLGHEEDNIVVLDEIQRKPDLFPVIRSLVDKKRIPGRFIILGSASPDLIRDSSESLAGRIAYLELNPLDLVEIDNRQSIDRLWLKGGFPDALLQDVDEISISWMRNFIRTYIERDLPMLGLAAPVQTTERLWSMLAHLNGTTINYSQIAGSLGVSSNTVKSYIQFFEHSFLIRMMQPYFVNIRKRLVKSPKLYFRDTGILHHMLRIFSQNDLYGHPGSGHSWESFVIQQIINNLPETVDTWFFRTQDGSELDLIITKGVKILAGIEIKHSNVPGLTRGNTLAINTLQINKNFIITPSTDDYPLREQVRVCNLETFIFKHLPGLENS